MTPAAATPVKCTAACAWGMPSSWARSNGGSPPSIAPNGEIVAGRHNDSYRSLWTAGTGGKPGGNVGSRPVVMNSMVLRREG